LRGTQVVDIAEIADRIRALQSSHNDILSTVDSAKSRVVTVESLYEELDGLTEEQTEYLRVALGCVENGFYRPAVVMGWAALLSRLVDVIEADNWARLNAARPKSTVKSHDDLPNDYQLIEAAKDAGFISKTTMKTLHGLLNTRNRAAHPGGFAPGLNTTLGYLEEAMTELRGLK